MKNTVFIRVAPCLALLIVLFSIDARAEINSAGVLDSVHDSYATVASTWTSTIQGHATSLFWTLALISMIWTFGVMALRKADIGEFFSEFIRFTVFTGFFWWLLDHGPTFAMAIINSMRSLGADAAAAAAGAAGHPAGPVLASPSGIIDIGFSIFATILTKSSVWSPFSSLVGAVVSLIILIVMALIAVNMLMLLISGWILAYAGIFFLGFGGARWTSDMAITYFKTVLNIGAQLLAMVLLVGVGSGLIIDFYSRMSSGFQLNELAVVMVVAIVLLGLINKVPGLVGSLASGGGAGALGSGYSGSSALAGASMAAAAIATMGAAMTAGAANIGGGIQALMAAFSKASAAEGAGSGSRDFMSQGNSGSGSSGSDSLAEAMGDMSKASSAEGVNSGTGSENGTAGGENSNTGKSATDNSAAASAESDDQAGESGQGGPQEPDKKAEAEFQNGQAQQAEVLPKNKMAKAKDIARGTVTNLGKGALDLAKIGAKNFKDNANRRMENTIGGKIASAIRASDPNQNKPGNENTSAANSLSAGNGKDVDAAAEVAAFRDRDRKE